MRIAFVIRSLGIGGAERQLTVLAVALAERGHAVEVIAYYGGGARHEEFDRAGVRVVSLDERGRWDLAGPLIRLRRAIRDFRPEVVHGYLPDGNLLALLSGRLLYRAAVVWGVRASAYDSASTTGCSDCYSGRAAVLRVARTLIIASFARRGAPIMAAGYPAERTVSESQRHRYGTVPSRSRAT